MITNLTLSCYIVFFTASFFLGFDTAEQAVVTITVPTVLVAVAATLVIVLAIKYGLPMKLVRRCTNPYAHSNQQGLGLAIENVQATG